MKKNIETWDAGGADLLALFRALKGDLFSFRELVPDDLAPMRVKGLVHAHVAIRGTKKILRIPRSGAFGLSPAANLKYQAACFSRAYPCGHVPVLHAIIPPQVGIPWGALIISEIEGCVPRLPEELVSIAEALASIHSLPVPEKVDQQPLPFHADPIAATLRVIEAQSRYMDDADITPASRRQIDEELGRAHDFAANADCCDLPITLVGTDTHPGNFMIQSDGTAVFVDLEKMLYGAPAIDLAHATVYTSTMWDSDVATVISDKDVNLFYEAYFSELTRELGDRIRPWCGPFRRITWLRTTTWCAKLRVESRAGAAWSGSHHDPEYIASVHRRIDDYFDPETIAQIREGFNDGQSA